MSTIKIELICWISFAYFNKYFGVLFFYWQYLIEQSNHMLNKKFIMNFEVFIHIAHTMYIIINCRVLFLLFYIDNIIILIFYNINNIIKYTIFSYFIYIFIYKVRKDLFLAKINIKNYAYWIIYKLFYDWIKKTDRFIKNIKDF